MSVEISGYLRCIWHRWQGLRFLLVCGLALVATSILPVEPVAAKQFRVGPLQQIRLEMSGDTPGDQVHYEKPRWAPDGQALTFETRRGKERRLYAYLVSAKESHQLLSERETSSGPGRSRAVGVTAIANYDAAWAPMGAKITYVGSGSLGYFGLYYVDVGDWANMTGFVAGGEGDPYVAFPEYFPGAEWVVFSKGEESSRERAGRLDLHAAESLPPVQGRRVESSRVLKGETMAGIPQLQPTFSPDGTAIAFVGIERGNNDIYTVPVRFHPMTGVNQGAAPQRLMDWPSPESRPVWSPDGRQIAFLSGRQESKEEWGLWVMSTGGGEARRLAGRVMVEDEPEWYDGQHLFVARVDEQKNNPLAYVDLQTGIVRDLDVPTLRHVYVDISPDGKRIAVCARGLRTDPNLTWLKLYVGDLTEVK